MARMRTDRARIAEADAVEASVAAGTDFYLPRLPPRVVVVGAGAVGVELAQAFALLGSSVTLLVRSRVLSREAPEASEIVEAALAAAGVRVLRLAAPSAKTV